MIEAIVIIGFILLFLHLLGGLFHHHRHYRKHGVHPNLYYTYGRGFYGSIRIGGFRIGHPL